MTRLVRVPDWCVDDLKRSAESGIGYQVVSVELKDRRRFDQVVTSEGFFIAVRGHEDIPFATEDVTSVVLNHNRWNFRDGSHARSRARAVGA